MKVSVFKSRIWSSDLLSIESVQENDDFIGLKIEELFFGNRPTSVAADNYLTGLFAKLVGLPQDLLASSCIIITNTEPTTEEDKQLTPRQFIERHMDDFEIAIQIL